MDFEKMNHFMDAHDDIMQPAQTHITRYINLTKQIAEMRIDTQDDLDRLVSSLSETTEVMEDIGNDLHNLGVWGVEFMSYLIEEIEKEPE